MAPRVEAPELPAWNTRDIEELGGNVLHWSTVVASHAKKHNTKSDKQCVFCGKNYSGGPKDITSTTVSKASKISNRKQSGSLAMAQC